MSIYVFYSELAEKQTQICWCKVIVGDLSGSKTAVVKLTHSFEQQNVPEIYASLKLEYMGKFVCYATPSEYDDYMKSSQKTEWSLDLKTDQEIIKNFSGGGSINKEI